MERLQRRSLLKPILAGLAFLAATLWIASLAPSLEVKWVVAILMLTIYLFVFEIVEVDVAAASIMVVLGLTTLFAPWMGLSEGLVDNRELFKGFSSNAVISIIAVMIIGAGLDKTGLMSKVAGFILRVGGRTEGRIIPTISGTVAFISSFMQNVGAAALFLPVVSRISARTGLPMSRLLMPMGFCAILGGTMTMVGSSPLILLNDLILASNEGLPEQHQMDTFDLFAVTPVGVALVISGIVYFVLAGRFVLPARQASAEPGNPNSLDYYREVYGLDLDVAEVTVPEDSPLVGLKLDDFEARDRVRIIAAFIGEEGERFKIGRDGLARDTEIRADMILGVIGVREHVAAFVEKYGLRRAEEFDALNEVLSAQRSGLAEVAIPPRSNLIGKSARDLWLRKSYGLTLLALHRGEKTYLPGEGARDVPLQAGDTLIVWTTWSNLAYLERNPDLVIITQEYPHEDLRPHKVGWALLFFGVALSMVLFTDIQLSVALLTGAMGMVLSGVLNMEEAYRAVSWKTVFLLASLIPLGLAVETSGTAEWIATETVRMIGHMPAWVIQTAIAVLATFFTLVMSNVGATVLLVPLAVNIAIQVGANPAVFALTVAIATSNSFLIPTHQVNALIMGPGGYRVPDFMKAGGIMTVLFIVVTMVMMQIVF